jgi:hypothetical protein
LKSEKAGMPTHPEALSLGRISNRLQSVICTIIHLLRAMLERQLRVTSVNGRVKTGHGAAQKRTTLAQ